MGSVPSLDKVADIVPFNIMQTRQIWRYVYDFNIWWYYMVIVHDICVFLWFAHTPQKKKKKKKKKPFSYMFFFSMIQIDWGGFTVSDEERIWSFHIWAGR